MKKIFFTILAVVFFIPSFVFADVVTVIPSDNPSNLCTFESSANIFMFSGFSPQPTDIMVMVQGCGETTLTWQSQSAYWGFSFGNYTVLESDFGDNLETATYQEVIDYGIYRQQTIDFAEFLPSTGGYIINLPDKNNIIASTSLATIGIFSDLSPISMIVVGIILGLALLDWFMNRFKSVAVAEPNKHSGIDWAEHINTTGQDVTGRKHYEGDSDD
jgi:hypothetical protein